MTEKNIRHISNSLYRKLSKSLSKLNTVSGTEAVHAFRVAYKKLRAYLRMLSGAGPGQSIIRIPKKLKKIYTLTGTIRDLQLQLLSIEAAVRPAANSHAPYTRLLNAELNKIQPELTDLLEGNPQRSGYKMIAALLPASFPLSAFRAWARSKMAAIHAIIRSGIFSDDNIHFIRKTLKDLDYTISNYPGIEKQQLYASVWKGKNPETITLLLENMGNYQDQCNAVALLKSYWLKGMPSPAHDWLSRLKLQWITNKQQQKKQLIKQLRESFGQ
jgi:CHAD domain-containing protein